MEFGWLGGPVSNLKLFTQQKANTELTLIGLAKEVRSQNVAKANFAVIEEIYQLI